MTGCEDLWEYRKTLHEQDVNAMEAKLGFDIDGDGDVGEMGNKNSTTTRSGWAHVTVTYPDRHVDSGIWSKGEDGIVESEKFWKMLCEFDEANYVMGAMIMGGEEEDQGNGLLSGHVYSMITCAEFKEPGKDKLHRMVCMRNPWGNSREWNGDFSDKSRRAAAG